ncbi:hypothetical protein [Nocardia sp. NPDC057353]|uniref:hypothetical protein n=1 Tax=Nocardia sp. NPDC057353 TaxID=3346104 RepID=UPI00362DA618
MIGHRPGVALAGVVVAVGLTVAGCAEPGPDTSPSVSAPAVPSVIELDAVLARAMSASVEERCGAIEGDGTDYELIDRHPKVPVFAHTVVAVRLKSSSRVWGRVQTTIDGDPLPAPGEVPFVFEGTSWKVQRDWICAMVAALGHSSRDC